MRNPLAYKAIEGATVFCKLRGNPYVELVHLLHQLLQMKGSDRHHICAISTSALPPIAPSPQGGNAQGADG